MRTERQVSVLRRLLPAIVLTGGGGALLAGMHASPEISTDAARPTPGGGPGGSSRVSTPTTVTAVEATEPTPPAAPVGGDGTAGGDVEPLGSSSVPATVPTTGPTVPPTTASATAPTTVPPTGPTVPPTTFDAAAPVLTTSVVPASPQCLPEPVAGPVVDTRWGPVQVTASVSSDYSLICAVDAPITPDDHRKSVRINDHAVPILNDSALFVQGTGFDSVSGATITSRAYKQSLQAILDGRSG